MDDSEVLARDKDSSDQLMDWWTFEDGIADETQVTCDADEVALVVAEGRVVDQLGPGRHLLTAQGNPALARYLGEDALAANVVFVWTTSFSLSFSGPAGSMVDPETGEPFDTFIVGGCGVEVKEPARLLALESGPSGSSAEEFLEKTLLDAARGILGASVSPASVRSGEDLPDALVAAVEQAANASFARLGLSVHLDGDLALTDEEPEDDNDEQTGGDDKA
jgi:hypothetical protein